MNADISVEGRKEVTKIIRMIDKLIVCLPNTNLEDRRYTCMLGTKRKKSVMLLCKLIMQYNIKMYLTLLARI
jgi:hypothetical protein